MAMYRDNGYKCACVLYALHTAFYLVLVKDLERGEKNEWILLALASKCDQYGMV